MKVLSTRLAAALVMAAAAVAALAGTQTSQQVTIQLTGLKLGATGDLGYVRNTPDTSQYIGCEFTPSSGDCYARDINGVTASCATTDPAFLEVMHSINGDGTLFFSWNPNGSCKMIRLQLDSRSAPK